MKDTTSHPVLKVVIALQIVVAMAIVLLPFGFDRPSVLGLDFDDLLAFVALGVGFLLFGVVTALVTHKVSSILDQLGIALLAAIAFIIRDIFF